MLTGVVDNGGFTFVQVEPRQLSMIECPPESRPSSPVAKQSLVVAHDTELRESSGNGALGSATTPHVDPFHFSISEWYPEDEKESLL
jgi:hypothetical protein